MKLTVYTVCKCFNEDQPDESHLKIPAENVDRSTTQQLAVTVGNVAVIITDFKEKLTLPLMRNSYPD